MLRRKRLKHSVDTFCRMFCGWRLVNSYAEIESLGTGILEIDALTGDATFNGNTSSALPIAGELHAWFLDDCNTHDIPISQISTATLTASLELTTADWKRRKARNSWFNQDGTRLVSHKIKRCVIECKSTITTDEGFEYRSQHKSLEEWPEGFPY